MCRDITFAAAVNSLVSFFFFLSIFFSGRRNYWRKCVSGSLFFFVCLLSPHSPLGIELQSLPNLFNFLGFFFLITKCQMKYYFLFISFFFLNNLISVTNGVMHLFRRCGHAHVRLQIDSYAYSNIGPFPNTEPLGGFHQ
jgi:hypothetical protein